MDRHCVDARPAEAANSGWCHQDVSQHRPAEVPSLDEGGAGAEPQQRCTGSFHRRAIVHHAAGQDRGLVQVWGDQRGEREQILSHYLFGLGTEEPGPRGGHHDRIDHERSPAVFPDCARYQPDQRGLGQHAGLERGRRKILRQCGELFGDHVFGDALDGADLPGVLGGQSDDHRRPEDAELLEGLEIRLDAGATAGIRSGNGEGNLHRASTGMSSSLQTLIRDLHRRRGRERLGLALAEGVRLVEEALAGGIAIRGAAVSATLESTTRGNSLKAALAGRGIRLEDVSESELEALADTEHPQGVIAVIEPRRWSWVDIHLLSGTTLLVLDGVQDPGNVGTMFRTALGLGAAGAVALKGTADLTNPKVLRAAMGASFKLPTISATPEEFVAWSRLQRAEIWVADTAGERVEQLPGCSPDRAPVALVLGNEGAGVSASLELAADRRVAIPLARGVESLNVAVAAGILLYEVTRAR